MSNPLESLIERPVESPDLAFVLSAWLKSFRRSQHAGVVPNNLYHETYKAAFDHLLRRGMVVTVICNKSNPDQLVGFIAYETAANGTPVLHYLFIKDVFRGHGIGKHLLQGAGIRKDVPFIYTFKTKDIRKVRGGIWVPTVARRKHLEPIYEITAKDRKIPQRG